MKKPAACGLLAGVFAGGNRVFKLACLVLAAGFGASCGGCAAKRKAACEKLDRFACTRAGYCTLVTTGGRKPSKGYLCRPARGKCEKDFSQADNLADK